MADLLRPKVQPVQRSTTREREQTTVRSKERDFTGEGGKNHSLANRRVQAATKAVARVRETACQDRSSVLELGLLFVFGDVVETNGLRFRTKNDQLQRRNRARRRQLVRTASQEATNRSSGLKGENLTEEMLSKGGSDNSVLSKKAVRMRSTGEREVDVPDMSLSRKEFLTVRNARFRSRSW